MASREMLRVIAYDITSDARRENVAEVLEEIAARVQYSVYEARLTHEQTRRLMARLKRLIASDDNLRIYTIPDTMLARCEAVGGVPIADGAAYWLL